MNVSIQGIGMNLKEVAREDTGSKGYTSHDWHSFAWYMCCL